MDWLYTNWAYSVIVLVSLVGLVLLDWRCKLILFRSNASFKAGLATVGCLVGFFLIWDIAGILLKIFYTNPRFTLGVNLGTPNLPIEEIMFLILLSYVMLLIYRLFETKAGIATFRRLIMRKDHE
ncbi:MAG: lycopene cyclase domain-containing protein [bacterium]